MDKVISQYIVKNASVEVSFLIESAANEYQLLLPNSTIEEKQVTIVTRTKSEQLVFDLAFGKQLIELFLEDNRNDQNVTTAQSISLLTRFEKIANLLRFGDIKTAKVLVEAEAVDTVFTQARKDRYLSQINSHLYEAQLFAE